MFRDNENRAKRAQRAVNLILKDPRSYEERVTDLLTDLRHFCDYYHLDWAQVDRTAYQHYAAEVQNG